MFEAAAIKREDSFEVIEGEENSATPEEASSVHELEICSDGKQTESCFFVGTEINVVNPVNPTTDEQSLESNEDERKSSSGEALSEDHDQSPICQTFGFHCPDVPGSTRTEEAQLKPIPQDPLPRSARAIEVEHHGIVERRWLFPVIFVLSGIILAQFFANRTDSAKLVQLQRDMVALKVHYAEGLLKESKERAVQDADARERIAELQAERNRLANDLRKHEAKQVESRQVIVDLQAERKKLMDALSQIEKQGTANEETIATLRSENARLTASLKRLADDVNRLRTTLLDIRRRSVYIPGARFFNRIICDILRMCPDAVVL